MNRKDLNFKSVIFKIFFTYLVVYFLALIFKYTYDFESILNNIQYKYLITLNIISIFLGHINSLKLNTSAKPKDWHEV